MADNNNENVHPLEGFMSLTMENLKQLIEVDTAIGKPIDVPDGSVIIPLSQVKFGFASGGSEFVPGGQKGSSQSESIIPFGGGSGGGVSITPTAFVVANKEGVKLMPVHESSNAYEKVLEKCPQLIDQVMDMLKQKKGSDKDSNDI
ncbi:GerW family sporulation protein [Gracilibacillus salinarum]|uniref:GerW family sporulation protein n=1 Tax=Gracilibacillus salinarum TaxID=2932255 RepID=A0ABY4GPH8_9BACI|nr:GerW family sporulation protein [Gracilibacillus salinarum]UOQ86293.1 GerW family sporulation protein [Gracilibacillus salinarum]